MHYYQFHISDYRSATAHLTNEEDLAYRRLLDMYYDTETPIPNETQWVSRRLRVGCEVVLSVLQDFFVLTDSGWVHERCDQLIADYHAMADRNRRNGSHGGRPKKPTGLQVGTQSKPTGNLTINNKPKTINHKPIKKTASTPVGVSVDVWESFVQLRKAKRAPLTPTALAGIEKEARKAGWTMEQALTECCTRGWVGFKADWVNDAKKTQHQLNQEGIARSIGLIPKEHEGNVYDAEFTQSLD